MLKKSKIHNIEGHKDLKRNIEAYFKIADPERLDRIKFSIFHPSINWNQRKKSYLANRKIIESLKPLFRKIKKAHIQIANDQGFDNYVKLTIDKFGIPEKKIDYYFRNVDKVIKQINYKLPIPKKTPSWYWSEFNMPDPLYGFSQDFKLNIPEDVYRMIGKYNLRIEKFKGRIKIEKMTDVSPSARFNTEDKTVTLQLPQKKSLYNTLTLVHELGHADTFLKLADKGIDPYTKSKYWHEEQAYKFKLEFEDKAFFGDLGYASKGEILDDFASTLFEYDIYSDPRHNFDKAYAMANNRCYPRYSKQIANPFYVLEKGFILRPFSTLMSSIVQTELLSRKI